MRQVIAGAIKWCWSRLQGGVVGWDAYELFKVGEQGMRRSAALRVDGQEADWNFCRLEYGSRLVQDLHSIEC